ncbi:hypothetical protein EV122DRAFT_213048 [Schizophyllum commune]
MPIVIPGVMEISAPRPDEEIEERDRLREAAAQSIGLSPELLQEEANLSNSIDMGSDASHFYGEDLGPFNSGDSTPLWDGLSSSASTRPVSIHRHSYSNPPAPVSTVPPFPTTLKALSSCDSHTIALSASFPKYHSSSRIFAMSRHWKTRYILLTSPVPPDPLPSPRSRHALVPLPSYLHVFRSPAPEERELERLEVNEDSVVFVADEDVGGRKNVIKVAGKHAGGEADNGKEVEGPPKAETMWLLHAVNVETKQTWIGGIKSVILAQRSVRAGLPQSALNGANEPRGDMDVMLSMRVSSHMASRPPIPPSMADPPQPRSPALSETFSVAPRPFSEHDTSSHSSMHSRSQRSLRSNSQPAASPGSPTKSPSTVSTLKGLFTRPRSPSVDSGVSQLTANSGAVDGSGEDSFGVMGNNLLSLSLARRSRLSEIPGSPTTISGSPTSSVPAQTLGLDRKISERQSAIWTGPSASSASTPTTPAAKPPQRPMSAFASSSSSGNGFAIQLQPPPRKRSAATNPPVTNPPQPAHDRSASEQSTSGTLPAGFSFHSPVQRPRQPSVGSVSTLATTMSEGVSPIDGGSSPSTKRSSRRWSTQGSLPKRMTPPSGPPPAAPTFHGEASDHHEHHDLGSPSSSRLHPHPYAAGIERSPSRTSQGRSSLESRGYSTYSKRASCSSAFSISSALSGGNGGAQSPAGQLTHLPQSHNANQPYNTPSSPPTSHRTSISMPPPRPPPSFALPPPPGQEPIDTIQEAPSSLRDLASDSRTSLHSRAPSLSDAASRKSFADTASRVSYADTASRKSFADNASRKSFSRRSFRLSLGAPNPPPATTLPPRPDEQRVWTRRRPSSSGGRPPSAGGRPSSSSGGRPGSSGGRPLSTASSPLQHHSALPPQQHPPPNGPLPPTPESAPGPARSFKQRLRMLSAPVMPSSPLPSPPEEAEAPVKPAGKRRPLTMTVMTTQPFSTQTFSSLGSPGLGATPPATPIAEKIVQNQNDPSFLQMYAPLSPVSPTFSTKYTASLASRSHPSTPVVEEEDPVMISLSPPPRRGSKHMGVRAQPEKAEAESSKAKEEKEEKEEVADKEQQKEDDTESKRTMFLSPHGSVISLGILSTQEVVHTQAAVNTQEAVTP